MGKKEKVLGVVVTLFAVAVVLHSVFQIFVYETGVFEFTEEGISGTQVGEVAGRGFRADLVALAPVDKSVSRWVLVIEWVVLLAVAIIFIVRRKSSSNKEFEELHISRKSRKKTGTTTDLDDLCDLMKDKKNLKLSTISKVYGVDKEVVMSWGKILESTKLVRVDYPFFGEPKFVYLEDGKDAKEKKAMKKGGEDVKKRGMKKKLPPLPKRSKK